MTLVIAHRGASRARPENTVPAFREARRMGADMVELDARRTADGAIAVHHDPAIPGLGPLHALSWAESRSAVPSLEEAIEACEGMAVNIEVKNLPHEPDWDPDETLAAAVARLVGAGTLHHRVLVSSFNRAAIARVRSADARIPTALLTVPTTDQREAIAACVAGGHAAIHPHHAAVDPPLLEAAHAAGLAVNTWTVDDPARMRELAAWGVDGICTNVPDVAVAVLRDLGLRARPR